MTNIEREIERIASRALRESHLSGGAPIGILDGLEAFAAAIDFTELPIVAIIAFHALFILTAILTRKKMEVQIGLLVVALLSVLSASPLNTFGSNHWQSLGLRQNYFDSFGVFVSVLGSMPLILTSFGILIHAIYHASSLLILVKRKQLGIDKKGSRQPTKKEATTAEVTTAAASSSEPSEAVRTGDVDGQSPPTQVAAAVGAKQRKSAKAR